MKRLLRKPEPVLAGIVIVLAGIVTAFNRDFLTLGNGLDLLKSYSFLGILALGVLVVLVSGGIDISFTATASVAQYVMATLVISHGGNVPVAFALAAAVGTLLGLVNALFIHVLRIPAIITTIATLNVYNGLLIFLAPADAGSRRCRSGSATSPTARSSPTPPPTAGNTACRSSRRSSSAWRRSRAGC